MIFILEEDTPEVLLSSESFQIFSIAISKKNRKKIPPYKWFYSKKLQRKHAVDEKKGERNLRREKL